MEETEKRKLENEKRNWNYFYIQMFYCLSTLVGLCLVVLHEKEGVVLVPELSGNYVVELFCIALAVFSLPVALKGYSVLDSRADRTDENKFFGWYFMRSMMMAAIICSAIAYNAILYASGSPNSLYCMAIGIISAFFAYPTKKRMRRLMKGEQW